jgi:urease accessory protein
MFAATSPSEAEMHPVAAVSAPTLQRGDGAAEIAFSSASGTTTLDHLYQRAPCRILFPDPPRGDLMTAVVATISGGITGNDRIRLDFVTRDGAAALATTQAAEKVYRSLGGDCIVDIRIRAESGTWLEWLPQETILFDQARLRRSTFVDVEPGARLMAGDILVLGRLAHGELFHHGFLRDAWRVTRKGRPMWMDALRLDGDVASTLRHPAAFGGAVAAATFVYFADDASERLEVALDLLHGASIRCGATCVNGVLIARFLSADAMVLRSAFGGFWAAFRQRVRGLPPRLPGVWNC